MTQQALTLEQALQLAGQWIQEQRFSEAETLCLQILKAQPQHADNLHLLAIITAQTQRLELSLQYIQRALQQNPQQATFYNTQGNVLLEQQYEQKALLSFQHGLQLKPDDASLHRNLGRVYQQQRDYVTAQEHFSQAVSLAPAFVEAWLNLGKTHYELKQYSEALEAWETALKLRPDNFKIRLHVGMALQRLNRVTEALVLFQALSSLHPNPLDSDVALREDLMKVWQNLGLTYLSLGQVEAALQAFITVQLLIPDDPVAYQHLLWTLNFVTPPRWQQQGDICQKFNALCQHLARQQNIPKPKRHSHARLRIGYLSVDLRDHPVGYFMQPILQHHDRKQFEVFCYYPNTVSSEHTLALKTYVEHWADVGSLNDEALIEHILADELDILVELGGHTEGSHLSLLGHKLAPIQVSYLGYPNSSCLHSIDYRITDIYVSPDEQSPHFPETLLRLPFAYHCYQPLALSQDLPVAPTPALQKGFITFASFNNYAKLGDDILSLWAEVLRCLPNSRLLMQTSVMADADIRQQVIQRFVQQGIHAERLILLPHTSLLEHLQCYHQVDICLDTYPYNGGTTTCHALWMGVPTLSLCGETQSSRMGYSILSTVGLEQWVAFKRDEFIEKAMVFSADVRQLQQLRSTMRSRLQASPLMDAQGFTQAIEEFYRTMYQDIENV